MSNSRDADASREGLLRGRKSAALRPSLDEAYRTSSESREELDELDLLDEDVNGAKYDDGFPRRRGKKHTYEGLTASKHTPRTRLRSIGKRLRPSSWKTCLIVAAIVIGGLMVLLFSGGYFVYKNAPKDGQSPPWYLSPQGGTLETWKESYQKAEAMVTRMSLVEKVNITAGTGWMGDLCVGNTGSTSVGFPALCLQDGPLGIRFADNITAFPAAITTGATFNRHLMYKRGEALGIEARLKGVNVLLAPSMGPLGRMPAGGRNWEGFGPDPVLQAVAANHTIRGIQDQGVMATAKHYILNEQEHYRQSFEWGLPNAISSNIDDRSLHELYLWPFAESVRAGVASVMCSYNMVNNSYACGNSKLINGILKDELGFQGFVQSDWGAHRSGVGSALAGLDMSMPGDGLMWMDGNSLWGEHLTRSVLNGSLPIERLNDMTTRIVASWFKLGQDNRADWPLLEDGGGPNFSSWTNREEGLVHAGTDDTTTAVVNIYVDAQNKGGTHHGRLARQIAAEGTVLVKNEDAVLPLNRKGLLQRNSSAKCRIGIFGEDAGPGEGPNACADRGCNQGTLASGWGSGAVDFPYLITPIQALKDAFDSESVDLTSYLENTPPAKDASSKPEDQELCIVFINSDGGEGFISWEGIRGDRNDLYAQKGGDELVRDVAGRCGKGTSRTVVVVHAVGPVIVERWIDIPGVKAVVLANLPGEESGNALVDVLFGDVDASGRLPYTVGKSLSDYGEGGQVKYYPGGLIPQQDFKEGLYIDYRHFDKFNITPRYEFGFGLSYTTFSFSSPFLETIRPKSPFPSPRPSSLSPPTYATTIPDPSTALFPPGFRKLKKYIYPYLRDTSSVRTGGYPYPHGYSDLQPPSPAGGGEGGNPSLFETHLVVSVTVTNTGTRKGMEVVQVYISFPDNVVDESTGQAIDFPPKQLRGFEKLELDAGRSKAVKIELTRKDLSYWSVGAQNWKMPEGKMGVWVGKSSRDLDMVGEW